MTYALINRPNDGNLAAREPSKYQVNKYFSTESDSPETMCLSASAESAFGILVAMKTKSNKHNATREAGKIQFSNSYMERTWKMFTKDGRPVFRFGNIGYTLEAAAHREHARAYEGDGDRIRQWKLDKAKAKLGVECEWREADPVQTMNVYF